MNNLAGNEHEELRQLANTLTEEQRGLLAHCFNNKLAVAMMSLSFYHGERGQAGKQAELIRGACEDMLRYVRILTCEDPITRSTKPTIECPVIVNEPPVPDEVEVDLTDL